MDETSEFDAVAVSEDQWVAWPRIAAVAAMVAFSLPTFITGLEVYHALSPLQALLALTVGSVIIFLIGALMGSIGAKTHMVTGVQTCVFRARCQSSSGSSSPAFA